MRLKEPSIFLGALLLGSAVLVTAAAAQGPAGPRSGVAASLLSGVPLPAPIRAEGGHRPQAVRLRDGNIALRNPLLVAVLVKGEKGYDNLAFYPAPRPGAEEDLPVAVASLAQIAGAGEGTAAPNFAPSDVIVRGNRVVLSGSSQSQGITWTTTVTLEIGDDPWLSWQVATRPSAAASVTRFTPFALRSTGGGPREALFPGVAYVGALHPGPGGPYVPDPRQITVPLMAVSQEGVTTALMWDARQQWGGTGRPGASFQPSDEDQEGSLNRMDLFVPSPNETLALQAGQEVRLSGKVLLLRERATPVAALRHWASAFGVGGRPEFPRKFDAERRLSRQAFTRRLWVASPPGWKYSTEATDAVPYPFGVQALLMDAGREADRSVSADLRQQAEQVLGALQMRGPLDPNLAYRTGGVPASLEAERDRITEIIREQLADGSWLFAPGAPHNPRPAPDDPVDLRVVAANALPVLRFAARTGDSDAAGAGRRAMDFLTRSIIPGAGTFRPVPITTADLTVAQQLAECFLLAFQTNGDRNYVESARHWANAGLAFVYLWGDPDRPAMHFGTVASMAEGVAPSQDGGLISQPVGLEYARVLQALHRIRPDDLYDRVSEGILANAMLQQSTTGEDAGLLPEHWNIRENRAEGAKLNPWPLLKVMYLVDGLDPYISQARVRVGSDRMFVASGATIENADTTATRLRLKLKWLPGQDTFTTITGVPELPLRLEYNSEQLFSFGIVTRRNYLPETTSEAAPGWFYDPDTGFMVVRLRHTGDDDHLEVRWPDPRTRAPVNRGDRAIRPHRQ